MKTATAIILGGLTTAVGVLLGGATAINALDHALVPLDDDVPDDDDDDGWWEDYDDWEDPEPEPDGVLTLDEFLAELADA